MPKIIVELYNLEGTDHDGYYYVEIGKGMYGLPQASRVAYDALAPRLQKAGYLPAHNPRTLQTPDQQRHVLSHSR